MKKHVIAIAILIGAFLALGGGASRSSVVHAQGRAKFHRHKGERVAGQYIVVFDENELADRSIRAVSDLTNELVQFHGGTRLHRYNNVVKGFSARMTQADAELLAEDPRVKYVEEDGVAHGASSEPLTPDWWGLDRIDQRGPTLDNTYNYYGDGTGVNVYILDSGIRVTHSEFEGRARGAFNARNDGISEATDCLGHGSHVASIAGGKVSGVAKQANLYSVRVLGCDNLAYWSDYVAGLDWIKANGIKPAVVNASIAGYTNQSATEAIASLVNSGITFVGAAANENDDACNYVPGAASEAIAVGSIDSGDVRASYSNFGSCVDIWAPGSAISGAYNGDDTSYTLKWGTSMASPMVAGAAALYLQRHQTATPAQVRAEILRGATNGALDTATLEPGSPNKLLFASYLGDNVRPAATLTAPSDGTTLSGTFTLSAIASDNVEMQGVRFYFGNAELKFDTTVPYSVNVNTSSVANGTYSLTARAIDLAGNVTDSTVTITVANGGDATLPTVSVTAPVAAATVRGSVTFSANASDNVAVARVEFLVDGALLAADTSSPYSVTWNTTTVSEGAHTLMARASDTANNTKTSTAVSVTVDNVPASTLPSGWTGVDVGAVGMPGSATFNNGTWALIGAGTDIFNTADAFQFVHRQFSGDGDLIARVSSLVKPTDAVAAYAGIMFRESLGANVRHATLLMGADGKVKFRRRTMVGGTTASDGTAIGTAFAARYLKLSRRGNVFTASISADGSQWTQVYTPQTITLPAAAEVGIWTLRAGAVSGLAAATFTNVTATAVLPTGWAHADVGAVGTPGDVSFANGTYTVTGAGTDLWGTADAFHYAYRSLTGNGTVVARLVSIATPADAEWGMGAVMMRDGTGATARHVATVVTTQGKAKFRRRMTAGGTTLSDGPSGGTMPPPRWLKLTRAADTFTASVSTDGVTWTTLGQPQTVALPATLQVGIVALRHCGTGAAQAIFTNVSVISP